MTVPSFQSFWNIKSFLCGIYLTTETKQNGETPPVPHMGTPLNILIFGMRTADSPTVTVYSDSSKEDSQVPYVCPSSLTLVVAIFD